jgi:hypothetical protein
MVLTRPDIAFAVSALSQYLKHPGIWHYHAAVQVFRYLAGTKDVGLLYSRNENPQVKAFVDSDWGNCLDTRRSVTGFFILVGDHIVNW